MPRGRPKQGSRTRYVHVIIKEVTHGRWEQAKKRLVTKTDDSLANYLLDLYLDDSPTLPRNDEQCNISQREQIKEAEGDIPLGSILGPAATSTPCQLEWHGKKHGEIFGLSDNDDEERTDGSEEETMTADELLQQSLQYTGSTPQRTVERVMLRNMMYNENFVHNVISADDDTLSGVDLDTRLEELSTLLCDSDNIETDESSLCPEETDLSDSESSHSDELNSASKDVEDSNGSHTADLPTRSSDSAMSNEAHSCERVLCSLQKILQLVDNRCKVQTCNSNYDIKHEICGCCLKITGRCANAHTFIWCSSDVISNVTGNRIFVDNLYFASAVVLSGNSFSKLELFFRFLNLHIVSSTTFHSYQRLYICPGIDNYFVKEQEELLLSYKEQNVKLAGDGRCDSPGSSAKFCTYTLMDIDTDKILHTITVDKREVALQSPNMEREAMKRALDFIAGCDITVEELVTDASSSVRKILAAKYPQTHHSMDIWHKAKKLKKALTEAGKIKGMEKLSHWSSSIINHFWHSCRTCGGDVSLLKDKWFAILHHVVDEHVWLTGLGRCDHEQLTGLPTDGSGKDIQYFTRNEKSFAVLRKLITDKKWLKSLCYYTRFRHTGKLESFHSHLLAYCPKRSSYQNQAYQTRIQLSILDHNKHCQREHMRSKDGNLLYHRKYRKQSKKWDATPTLTRKKYEYIPRIMSEICKARADSDSNLKRKVVLAENHPGRIQKTIGHCNPEETHVIVSNKRSRFS